MNIEYKKNVLTAADFILLHKELETDRLFLKNISSDDRGFIFTLFSNDDVNKFLYDAEPLTDISGADDIINFYLEPEPRNQHRWVIIRKTDNGKILHENK